MKLIFFSLLLLFSYSRAFSNSKSYDPFSFSNLNEITTKHFHIQFKVDFVHDVIFGNITLNMEVIAPSLSYISLDSSNQTIKGVYLLQDNGSSICLHYSKSYVLLEKSLGERLSIALNKNYSKETSLKLKIDFVTSVYSRGLTWVPSHKTQSKTLKYLYTKCEPIYCRAIFPHQDSPSVKSTYTAQITYDSRYTALMSANKTETRIHNGLKTTSFNCSLPIPSYLFTLNIGDIVERQLANNSFVYADPTVIDKAEEVSKNLPKIVALLERYLGPSPWGNNNIIWVPSNYPSTAMENPLLVTFTSYFLDFDKFDIENVIAHEFAHFWSGNLVTCKNFLNTWINEGITNYLSFEVVRLFHNNQIYQESLFLEQYGYEMNIRRKKNGELTKLNPKYEKFHPSDTFSSIAYGKGAFFMVHLQSLLGESLMWKFLKEYFSHFSFQSITSDEFLEFLQSFISSNFDPINAKIIQGKGKFLQWIKSPGLPPTNFEYSSQKMMEARKLANSFIEMKNNQLPSNYKDFFSYSNNLKSVFISQLGYRRKEFQIHLVETLAKIYNLDSEYLGIRGRWFDITLSKFYRKNLKDIEHFLSLKASESLESLYVKLAQIDKPLAKRILRSNEGFYSFANYELFSQAIKEVKKFKRK